MGLWAASMTSHACHAARSVTHRVTAPSITYSVTRLAAVAATHSIAATHPVAISVIAATHAVAVPVIAAHILSGIGDSVAEMLPSRSCKKYQAGDAGGHQKHDGGNRHIACHWRKSSVVSALNYAMKWRICVRGGPSWPENWPDRGRKIRVTYRTKLATIPLHDQA